MSTPIKRASELVPGGYAGIGRALGGISHRTVWAWHARGRVPKEYCPQIELLTGGAVRCEELNPDVDWQAMRLALSQSAALTSGADHAGEPAVLGGS